MVALFRSAKVSPETTVRVANINEPGHGDHRGYSGNFMRTAKYTYLNFLFKFFWNFVLRRVAYLYFILISVLQIGTDFSPTGKLTTIGPLSVIILFSMINEFWQDQRRRKADREVNARPSRVLRGGDVLLGVGAALMLFPPTRFLLKKYVLPTPGQGPSREARDAGKFASEVYAAGPAGIAVARVESGDAGDGGYKATARMSTEAALTLALDREKCAAGGVSTPAAAMATRIRVF